jgi:hypothetical protein
MVIVCTKHVNKGLKMLHLPHVLPISSEDKANGKNKCHFCGHPSDYKLFNYYKSRIFRI